MSGEAARGAYYKGPPGQLHITFQRIFHLLNDPKDFFRVLEQHLTPFRQLQFFAIFPEQLEPKGLVKGLYLHGDRWLCDVEDLRRLGDTPFPCHKIECPELIEIYLHKITSLRLLILYNFRLWRNPSPRLIRGGAI